MVVSQVVELNAAIAALELGPEHAGLVGYCRGLAEVIDAHPERATLWREYRPALESLIALGRPEEEDDGQASFLELVRTPVGDSSDSRKKNARAGGS